MKDLVIFLIILLTPSLISAAQKEFVREYSYIASEYDSKVSARQNATEQMRAILLREIGEVVIAEQKMESASNSNQYIYDNYSEKITAIAASMVNMEILQENWNGQKYYIRAKMLIDPSDVSKRANEVLLNYKEVKTLQDKNREVLREIEKLNKEISGLKVKMRNSEDFLLAEINEYKIQIGNYLGQISRLKQINAENSANYKSALFQRDSIINSQNLMIAKLSNSQDLMLLQKDSIINSLNLLITELKNAPKAVQKPVENSNQDEIAINTTPSGALVYVNDKYVGKTPYLYKNSPHGKITVRVKLSGFEPHTWNIDYNGGKESLNKKF
jgi:hypothetical protein